MASPRVEVGRGARESRAKLQCSQSPGAGLLAGLARICRAGDDAHIRPCTRIRLFLPSCCSPRWRGRLRLHRRLVARPRSWTTVGAFTPTPHRRSSCRAPSATPCVRSRRVRATCTPCWWSGTASWLPKATGMARTGLPTESLRCRPGSTRRACTTCGRSPSPSSACSGASQTAKASCRRLPAPSSSRFPHSPSFAPEDASTLPSAMSPACERAWPGTRAAAMRGGTTTSAG